jgi:hypothetical protein
MVATSSGAGGGAGDGFQVVMSELLTASSTFGSEAATFKAIMPDDGPACPNGGSGAINQSLSVMLQLIGTLHLQAAGVMQDDSAKLQAAHDNYARTEESLTRLCSQIISPGNIS